MSYYQSVISQLEREHRLRSLRIVEGEQDVVLKVEGKVVLNFSSNNYLGIANHPRLIKAFQEASERYGVGAGASRLVTGSMRLHHRLEETLALFKGTEKALLFNSGYQANLGIISTLAGRGDAIFSDSLNHASLIDGCRLSRAGVFIYPHRDVEVLEWLLEKEGTKAGKRLIVTDGIFSMEGDLCPLPQILELAERFDCQVLVDDAHGTGVYGPDGKGVVNHFFPEGPENFKERLVQMGTMGKALGGFGAFVAANRTLVDLLINKSRTFIFSTALPPAVAASGLEALKIIKEEPDRRARLWDRIHQLQRMLKDIGINVQAPPSPILPLVLRDDSKTIKVSQTLFESGFWVQGIRPPSVPEGGARLRLTLMATHEQRHLEALISCLADLKLPTLLENTAGKTDCSNGNADLDRVMDREV
jgi:glycine C-acetyltransferase/8-amino-7-oxononanoate synthase